MWTLETGVGHCVDFRDGGGALCGLRCRMDVFSRGSVSLAGCTTGLVSISISLGRFSWSISSFVFNYKKIKLKQKEY